MVTNGQVNTFAVFAALYHDAVETDFCDARMAHTIAFFRNARCAVWATCVGHGHTLADLAILFVMLAILVRANDFTCAHRAITKAKLDRKIARIIMLTIFLMTSIRLHGAKHQAANGQEHGENGDCEAR